MILKVYGWFTFRCFCHIVFRSETLDLRSFRARLLSASLSLLAANSSWRLAMLFSGMSSLSLFRSCEILSLNQISNICVINIHIKAFNVNLNNVKIS